MELKKFLPDASLREMIRFYWFMEGDNDDSSFSRILPFGALDLIIHKGTPMSLSKDFKTSAEPRAFVEGQYKNYQLKKLEKSTSLVGVSIQPWASELLFGMPSLMFTGEIVDLNLLADLGYNELIDIVHETNEKEKLIQGMDVYFKNRLSQNNSEHSNDLKMFSSKLTSHHEHSIQEISEHYWDNSLRLLQIRFKETFGLTISEYRRKQKLQKAVEKLNNGQSSLTSLALDLGFFDQAHFTRTFKSFAGISPRRYLAEQASGCTANPVGKLFS